MAILFCPCGQNLRDQDQTGDRAQCPACGRPVRSGAQTRSALPLQVGSPVIFGLDPGSCVAPPVPTIQLKVVEEIDVPPQRRSEPYPDRDGLPAYRLADTMDPGRASELARQIERRRAWDLQERRQRELAARRQRARIWPLETHWYECLMYPLRAFPQAIVLGTAWATLIALTLANLPEQWGILAIVVRLPLFLLALPLFALTCATMQATLSSAMAGKTGPIGWPGFDLASIIRGGSQGLLCFVGGPAVIVGVAFYFWLDSGDLEIVDWLILWELGLVAVSYWVLAMLAVQETGQIRDANPVAVLNVILRLKMPVCGLALLIATLLVGSTFLHFASVESVIHSVSGWEFLSGCWAFQFCCFLFLLRWFGIRRFHNSKKPASSDNEPPVVQPVRRSTAISPF